MPVRHIADKDMEDFLKDILNREEEITKLRKKRSTETTIGNYIRVISSR